MSNPSNHFEVLKKLRESGVRCRGAVVDSRIAPNGTQGVWRNDTQRWVILTSGLISSTVQLTVPLPYLVSIQVGSRQVTGGQIRASTVFGNGNPDDTQNAMTWPGLGQPIPPGEQLTTTTDTANANAAYAYTAVIVDDPKWKPPVDWLEPRWVSLQAANITGQQTLQVQLGYRGIVWDWMRGQAASEYLLASVFRFLVEGLPITLNALSMVEVPTNAYKPSAQILQPFKNGTNLWFYIDVAAVAAEPSIVVRLAKYYGDRG